MPALSNMYPLAGVAMPSKSVMTGLVPEALVVIAHVFGFAAAPPVPPVAAPPVPPDDVPAVGVTAVPPVAVPLLPMSSGASLLTQPTSRPPVTSTAATAEQNISEPTLDMLRHSLDRTAKRERAGACLDRAHLL